MADYINEKDYGDYFRRLERELEEKNSPKREEEAFVLQTEPDTEYEASSSKCKAVRFGKIPIVAAVAVVLAVVMIFTVNGISKAAQKDASQKGAAATQDKVKEEKKSLYAVADENTAVIGENITSRHIIVIDTAASRIVAERDSSVRTSPASTTKIMTALVACEQITNFDDTFEMIIEITDPIFLAGATSAGFSIGEKLTMSDLLYGCILPSGGDAALGLAYKISGNEENFVKLMNEKCRELGLKDTHFTNCTGLYDKDHYSTAADMAVILEAAMQDPFCRKLLSTFQYTTSKTEQHPEGITMTSTLFSYMYGTEPETAQIDGGKTGYVNESGFCIASFGQSQSGKQYICVTLGSASRWPAVFDQIELYKVYAK